MNIIYFVSGDPGTGGLGEQCTVFGEGGMGGRKYVMGGLILSLASNEGGLLLWHY